MWHVAAAEGSTGVLNTPTLASLLGAAILALTAVFYSMLRGKLRPESALKEVREDRDARVREAREYRDARLAEASRQIESLQKAYDLAEEARRSQEALLRETTLEIGRTVQNVLGALQEARLQAQGWERPAWGPGNQGEYSQDG